MSPLDEHRGWGRLFGAGRLTLGLFFPIEAYRGDTPAMTDQERLARRAEALGFDALWFRDVPLRDPSFGDVGQIYDPWVYLGHIGALTHSVALVTGAIVLPVRHPLHVAKAAASVDLLSGRRLVLGVASGDRPRELGAFGVDPEQRGERFREHLAVMRRAWREPFPELDGPTGRMSGLDPIPKPAAADLPVLVVGRSQQTLPWIARHAEGWVTYPRPPEQQAAMVTSWRAALREAGVAEPRPFAQSLYVDLHADPDAPPRPIHLGWALGRRPLLGLLARYREAGVEHVVLNLKYGRRPAAEVVEELGAEVLPRMAEDPRCAGPSRGGARP